MDKQDTPDRQCCSESTVAENHEESFSSGAAVLEEYNSLQTLTEEDPVAQSIEKQPCEEPNEMVGNDIEDETLQRSELILLPKIEIKCEPEDETNEEENPEETWQTLTEEDSKREPNEEPNELLGNDLEDEALQWSDLILHPKIEIEFEPEDEMNEEEDPQECDAERSNMLSGSNVLNFPWNMNNPGCSHDSGDLKKINKKIVVIASGALVEIGSNNESASEESRNETMYIESESDYGDIIGQEEMALEGQGSDSGEGQRCISGHRDSKRNENIKYTDGFFCEKCGKCFRYNSLLENHHCVCADVKHFKCSFCEKSFPEESALVDHMSTHLSICQECGKSFTTKGNLVSHMRVHSTEKRFKCSICGKAFNYSTDFIRHNRMHTGDKPFNCTVCKKAFSQKNHLTAHRRTHTVEKTFNCDECKRSFLRESNLIKHACKPAEEKPFKCSLCEKTYALESTLDVHMRTHSDDFFNCARCGKVFGHRDLLTEHLRSHLG